MHYFIIAGLGGELFEAVKKSVEKELRSKPVLGKAIKTTQPYMYSEKEVATLATMAREALAIDIAAGKTRFLSLIYAPHPNDEDLISSFLPATLNFRLPREINSIPREKALPSIMKAVRSAQSLSGELNTIFESKIRKSAVALPFRNYQVEVYGEKIAAACSFNYDDNPSSILEISGLPTLTTVSPKISVFADDRNLLFFPAKRREFHGHEVSGDIPLAWLKGAFRIGRSVPVGFHYDVRPERPPLSRFNFEDCEKGVISPKDEHAYINITPNDRTRLGKK
ncbi:hypothetical protein ELI00_03800 [Rhizobium ruizarguesonis]|uniref:hypothetical protein n=1 Tax=Rhizobium ruizarguesonis TaxID=2081791 RepID=UPI00102F634E|nr:hypothetical protein [Rhizobium ruizarguesonis]TAX75462.1 hypothetical protein ELI00_03800 [Rhizobium ruizarguesonis]